MSTGQYPKRRETDAQMAARQAAHAEDWRDEWEYAVERKFELRIFGGKPKSRRAKQGSKAEIQALEARVNSDWEQAQKEASG